MIIGAFLRRAWPYIALAGLVLLVMLLGKRIGALNAALEDMEARIDLQERMRDAAANTPTDKRSVVDRLREGGW